MHVDTNPDPDPDSEIALSFEEFSAAVDQLRMVGFPIEREAAEAWPHFRGWRVNYEALAYGLAYRTDQVPAPWSGPRRWGTETIPVQRPNLRAPGKGALGPKGKADGQERSVPQAGGSPPGSAGKPSPARND
jgi:hypothetical protein